MPQTVTRAEADAAATRARSAGCSFIASVTRRRHGRYRSSCLDLFRRVPVLPTERLQAVPKNPRARRAYRAGDDDYYPTERHVPPPQPHG